MGTAASLNARKVQLIIDQVDNLPTLAAVATRVLALASSDDTSARELTQIIEADQSLTSRILALVNSAAFGPAKSVATVGRAVMLLGFEAIRVSVLSLKVFDLFSRKSAGASRTAFDRASFWKHSLAVAAASQMIARRVRGTSPEEAFVAGLLHDIGKVALDYALPKTFDQVIRRVRAQRVSFIDAESRILGLDHAVIGKRLAQNWEFPEPLVNIIWLHHQSPAHLPASLSGLNMVRIVHLADLLAREQRIGMTSPVFDAGAVAAAADDLGLSLQQVESIGKGLHAAVAEHIQIMGLEQSDEKELFYESLQSANVELGEISHRLLLTTRKLDRQKHQADVLSQLGRAAGDATALHELLSVAADAFLCWLEADRCAVYVCGPRQEYVEGAVRGRGGKPDEHFLFDAAGSDVAPMASALSGQDAQGLARAELSEAWLFERVGNLMGRGPFYTFPISVAGDRLGAVVFSEPAQGPDAHAADRQQLLAMAATIGMAVCRLRERDRLLQMVESLAEANRCAADAQKELLRRRNLASVGAMAAGAAHEINNPLAVISGRAQMLAETEQDEGRRKALQIIVEQAERASGIISELMSFARPPTAARRPTDVSVVARGAVENRAGQLAAAGIEISTDLVGDLPPVSLDGRQVQWAIEELIANAAAATPRGGRVVLHVEDLDAGAQLAVSVIDNGAGMDHETLSHACDPFFSGRRAGRGRGLGLAKVQRIAEANGAALQIESAVGQGTTVRLVFNLDPAAEQADSPMEVAG